MTTATELTIEAGDEITTLDEANAAAIDAGLALRVQPPAPNPTVYYAPSGGNWYKGQAHRYSDQVMVRQVNIDGVRQRIERFTTGSEGRVTVVEIEDSPFESDWGD